MLFKEKSLLLFILFLPTLTVLSADDFSVTIEGFFPGAEGKHIRLLKYADQITYNNTEIDEYNIEKNGTFAFQFRIHEPVYVFYRVDHARMGHYVEPGNNYRLEFDPVNFDTLDDRRNPYLNPWYFSFKLYNQDAPDKLNRTISEFNNLFDDFLLEHFTGVVRRRLNKQFEDFRNHTDSLFEKEIANNSFFRDYYEYKFALYYRIANVKTPVQLFEEYIINRPILYENPQYMSFFNTMFDKYLFAGSRNITVNDLTTSVNRHKSYNALMDSLGKDTILLNEVLRELVMLKGLNDMYHNHSFNKKSVFSIIQHINNDSKFPKHRTIAGNMIHSITHLKRNYPAPPIELRNKYDTIVCLDNYKDKFLLINFWATWCVACQAEFSVMKDLYMEFNDQVEFLSISVDRNFEDYKHFVKTNDLPWQFEHFNDNFRLLDRYEVVRFPLFVLIDPEGNIVDNSAPFPSRGLDRRIARMIFDWERSQR